METVQVKSCNDCPLAQISGGYFGDRECGHPETTKRYLASRGDNPFNDDVTEDYNGETRPEWCPLLKQSLLIEAI